MDSLRQLHVRIPKDVFVKLKVKCAYEGTSIQDYIVTLVEQGVGERTGAGGSLLIVEDETILREALHDYLKETYVVTTVCTAEEALDLVKSQDFDVVVADERLPGLDGLDLVEKLSATRPCTKCVVITAYPSIELAVEAMKQGAADFLVKPFRVEDLDMVIGCILPKRRAAKEA